MTQQDLKNTNRILMNLETIIESEAKMFKRKGKHVIQIPLESGPKKVTLTLEADRIGYCIEWFSKQLANHFDLKEGRWSYTAEGGAEVIVIVENVKPLN